MGGGSSSGGERGAVEKAPQCLPGDGVKGPLPPRPGLGLDFMVGLVFVYALRGARRSEYPVYLISSGVIERN